MSEVLIRMKMPQCCEDCRFFAWKRGVGQHCTVDDRITFYATLDGFDVGYERNGDCPLIEIPKHGRLVDKLSVFKETSKKIWWCSTDRDIAENIVANAPTIIPAEEE